MSPDSELNSRNPRTAGTTSDTSSAGTAVMPTMAPLRVDSELKVWWAMSDAFGGVKDTATRFFDDSYAHRAGTTQFYNVAKFIHLISGGNGENLLSDDNKFRLARLGVAILAQSQDSRYHTAAVDFSLYLDRLKWIESSATPDEKALGDWWINPDNLPMWPPQAQKTEISVHQPLNLQFFEVSKAHQKGPWTAAMIGLLALRINSYGFGPQEEQALRMLGGSPEHFRASVEQNSRLESEGSITPSGFNLSDEELTRQYLKYAADVNFSSRFDGMTIPQVEKVLDGVGVSEEVRSKLIAQVEDRHARMMEGPAKTGERRILAGRPVWESNLREQLPKLSDLNHLDLSGLSLEGAVLSSKEFAGCRFNDTNLSGAQCVDTTFLGARFGTANLTGANLTRSDLRGADLSEATLSETGSYFADSVSSEISNIYSPAYDSTTRFIPEKWDNPFYRPTPEEKETQKNRFEGWTPKQLESIAQFVGPLQRKALKRLANLLREDAKNKLILPPLNQAAHASEFLPNTLIGNINEQELETALSRYHVYVSSAGLPLLKGNHRNTNLTDQELTGGFIVDASLVNATMTNQNLDGICISNSNLSGINLKGASLRGATLVNVDLTGADLRGVDLTDTNFVNCNLDRVLLDGVKMIGTQVQGGTLSNLTIGEGVIDLIACESILTNISFAGRFEGSGLFIQGIGLVDSMMTNAQFSGFTTVNQIELLGSLLVGAGPGILDDAEIIVSRESEWRDQMIQVARDAQLGEVTYALSTTGGVLQEHIFWAGQKHGTVPRFQLLQGIGYQPGKVTANNPSDERRLILPARVQ